MTFFLVFLAAGIAGVKAQSAGSAEAGKTGQLTPVDLTLKSHRIRGEISVYTFLVSASEGQLDACLDQLESRDLSNTMFSSLKVDRKNSTVRVTVDHYDALGQSASPEIAQELEGYLERRAMFNRALKEAEELHRARDASIH